MARDFVVHEARAVFVGKCEGGKVDRFRMLYVI